MARLGIEPRSTDSRGGQHQAGVPELEVVRGGEPQHQESFVSIVIAITPSRL